MVVFSDRVVAGRKLAERLGFMRGEDAVVLGLPRGGVPVAFEVAEALGIPLDVIVVRKLGVPIQPELAMGAIGEEGVRVLNDRVLRQIRVTDRELRGVEARERKVLDARVASLRGDRGRIPLVGRTAIIVDDGIATGATARVACAVARHLGAARVVVAVPVAPVETIRTFPEADEVVCLWAPEFFGSVGAFYRDFSATSDAEVARLLDSAAERMRRGGLASDFDGDVQIPLGTFSLEGHLYLPEPAPGVVLFAHGSGSSRHSPRNRFVATVLAQAGLGTLLLDLLTTEEEVDRANVRSTSGSWPTASPPQPGGSGPGRMRRAARSATSGRARVPRPRSGSPPKAAPRRVAAVVSRGGRPDLAAPRLGGGALPHAAHRGRRRHRCAPAQPLGAGPADLPVASWPLSRAPRTCSRSRAPWPRPPSSPAAGSCGTYCQAAVRNHEDRLRRRCHAWAPGQ